MSVIRTLASMENPLFSQASMSAAAVKRDLIGELPKMRRAGRTDVSDLADSVNSLTPVSEPLYAVA